ncbi:transposase [Streptosporangium minutum]|uniref:Insertion element IS402-like domain-containing protein n=1 Tax=Streptosporangium minutum TaxID=569862 RepID=A0A243RUC0_9ACTN|nr:hypothetical protein CA984_05730 [Streptosporangium minutum]
MAVRIGSPWRDPPAEYGPWSTVYDRFRSWATAGVFEELTQAMIAEAAKKRGSRGGPPAGRREPSDLHGTFLEFSCISAILV